MEKENTECTPKPNKRKHTIDKGSDPDTREKIKRECNSCSLPSKEEDYQDIPDNGADVWPFAFLGNDMIKKIVEKLDQTGRDRMSVLLTCKSWRKHCTQKFDVINEWSYTPFQLAFRKAAIAGDSFQLRYLNATYPDLDFSMKNDFLVRSCIRRTGIPYLSTPVWIRLFQNNKTIDPSAGNNRLLRRALEIVTPDLVGFLLKDERVPKKLNEEDEIPLGEILHLATRCLLDECGLEILLCKSLDSFYDLLDSGAFHKKRSELNRLSYGAIKNVRLLLETPQLYTSEWGGPLMVRVTQCALVLGWEPFRGITDLLVNDDKVDITYDRNVALQMVSWSGNEEMVDLFLTGMRDRRSPKVENQRGISDAIKRANSKKHTKIVDKLTSFMLEK